MTQKILIIQTAFIGDVILATAVLESLHKSHPKAELHFLLRKGNESLFKDHPFLENLLVWDKKEGKYSNLFRLLKQIRSEKYDVIVNLQRFAASGFLTIFSGAKRTIGFSKNPLSIFFSKRVPHIIDWNGEFPTHEVDRNHRLISDLVDADAEKPKLYPSLSDQSVVKSLGLADKYICLAPASVWFTKQFPLEKWAEFAASVDSSIQVYLIGAPSDESLCQELIKNSKRTNIQSLCGKLNLLQSAWLMKGAMTNYVNDSAPMHLCSALNAPVTAVYCSTIPEFGFGPLSDQSIIVQTKHNLDCRPCGLHGFKACPKKHFNCAQQIDNEQLLDALNK